MTRLEWVRLSVACVLVVGAAVAGFGGPYNLLWMLVLGGLISGAIWAPLVLPVVAVLPAWFVDTGTAFHADRGADHVLGALVVFGGGAVATSVGVLASVMVEPGGSRLLQHRARLRGSR